MRNSLDEYIQLSQSGIDTGCNPHPDDIITAELLRGDSDIYHINLMFVKENLSQLAHIHVFHSKGSDAAGLFRVVGSQDLYAWQFLQRLSPVIPQVTQPFFLSFSADAVMKSQSVSDPNMHSMALSAMKKPSKGTKKY